MFGFVWPWELFTDFDLGDITAAWASDLIATLLCWGQMLWCWFYTTTLDLLHSVLSAALPSIPDYGAQINVILPYYAAVDRWLPMTEILSMSLVWLPTYVAVRSIFTMIPFFTS